MVHEINYFLSNLNFYRCHGWIRDKTTFLTFSFLLRLIGGAFDAGLYPAAFAVFAVEFPALMSTAVVR